MPDPIRLVVLVSGGGTTLQNLIDRIADGRLNAQVAGVVASKPAIGGIGRAQRAGIPVAVVSSLKSASPKSNTPTAVDLGLADLRLETFPERVWAAVRGFDPQLVCLGGWLHLLPIPPDFRHRVLNIHPSLLPAFGGKGMYGHHVHEAVLTSGAKVSGCTVHFADDTYDTGPIVLQKCVPVMDDDTPDALAARVFAAECEAYPEAIRLVGSGGWRVEGRRVVAG